MISRSTAFAFLCLLGLAVAVSVPVHAALRVEPIPANTAVTVKVPPGKERCFYDDVRTAGLNVFWHFEVVSGGDLDIDAKVLTPDNQLVWSSSKERDARVLFRAQMTGEYQFCLDNKMSTMTAKAVAHSILVGDNSASTTKASDKIESMALHLADGLTEIKNEQQYLRTRERIHRDTTESTNTRVVIFSLLEILLFVAVSAFQILHLKRAFDKRRSV
jgi:protein ERP2